MTASNDYIKERRTKSLTLPSSGGPAEKVSNPVTNYQHRNDSSTEKASTQISLTTRFLGAFLALDGMCTPG